MSPMLAVVGVITLLVSALLLYALVRSLRFPLALLLAPRRGLAGLAEGPCSVSGTLKGSATLRTLSKKAALYTSTELAVSTRRSSGGKVIYETATLGDEAQPGAEVVPLALVDDEGREVALCDIEQIEVQDGACELYADELSPDDFARRHPELFRFTMPEHAIGVRITQRFLPEGARVVVQGVARRARGHEVSQGDSASYRDAAAVPLEVGGAACAGPLVAAAGRIALVSRIVASTVLVLAFTSLMALSGAWALWTWYLWRSLWGG